MIMKLWNGRFTEEGAKSVEEFTGSLSFDYKLYWHDILGSIAHVKMLGECGILETAEAERICDALVDILADIEKGTLEVDGADDIHSFIEGELTKRIGALGKKLQTARSRNDQLATDIRLYLKDSIVNLSTLLKDLVGTLLEMANANIKYYMPGYTHSRISQPVNVAHYINSYSETFLRDIERFADCYKRTDVMPLGSGALAGTNYNIDRTVTARLLNFSEISQNSIDAVSDRDFVLEYLFCCATVATHLSRFCEDLIMFSSESCGFIEIADAYSNSSSMLPQAKFPSVLELIRGKTGRVYGNLTAMLTTLKGLPSSFNKDLQEDFAFILDSQDTVQSCLKIFNETIRNISFDTRAMRSAAIDGYSAATDVADYLVAKGLPFREAYELTGKIVKYCVDNNTNLSNMKAFNFQSFSTFFEDDIEEYVKVKSVVENKKGVGSTNRSAVRENIRSITRRLNKLFK